MNLIKPITGVILLSQLIPIAFANDSDKEEIEQIVVTGTRTAKLLSNSPVKVDVISGETIAQLSQSTLAQALNFIPGVVVTRSQKDGYNIQMQGFDSQHVLVLVDSQPLVSPTGSSVDLDQIPATDIQQIEVIKGAASVMYGSSAMGGVINIITKQYAEPATSLTYEIGQYVGNEIEGEELNHVVKLHTAHNILGWNTKANISYIDDTGFDYDKENIIQDAASQEKLFAQIKTQKAFDDLRLSLAYQLLDEESLKVTGEVPIWKTPIHYKTDVTQHQFDLGLQSHKSQEPWQLNLKYIQHDENSGQSTGPRDAEIELIEVNGQNVWQFENIELVAGGVVHGDKFDQVKPQENAEDVIEIDNESRESVEGFVQANWDFGKHQWLAGVRTQWDSDFDWHNAVRLSHMYSLKTDSGLWQIRTGIGQSYRVPNLKERFYIFDHSNLGYVIFGNEDLVPETAESINSTISYNTSIWDDSADFNTELNLFFSQTEDLITTVINPERGIEEGFEPHIAAYEYQNIGEADRYGFDYSAELLFNQWQYQLNYSYLDSEDKDSGDRLEGRPRHQVKANITYNFENIDADALFYAVYQADEVVPDSYSQVENNEFTTVNFSFKHHLPNDLVWRLNLDNVFDEHKDENAETNNAFDARAVSSRKISLSITYTL